jgi:hypothetical protein
MAIGFGDLTNKTVKSLLLLWQDLLHPQSCVMAAVRGRPLGLPVFSVCSRFANLRTAATLSFGDD